jgi:hypothetical protein
MSIAQFTVQPSASTALIGSLILIATGIVVLSLAFFAGRRSKKIRATFVVMMIIGIATVGFGVWSFFDFNSPSTITIGTGYVSIQSSGFGGAGNLKVTSGEIVSAYVGQIGSGNLSLTKQQGTNYDNVNIGVYTLGNGKTANVVSENSTDLIIQLNNDKYVILGTSNTNALASSFSQNVYPLKSP